MAKDKKAAKTNELGFQKTENDIMFDLLVEVFQNSPITDASLESRIKHFAKEKNHDKVEVAQLVLMLKNKSIQESMKKDKFLDSDGKYHHSQRGSFFDYYHPGGGH